jgi:hypothetical protein
VRGELVNLAIVNPGHLLQVVKRSLKTASARRT